MGRGLRHRKKGHWGFFYFVDLKSVESKQRGGGVTNQFVFFLAKNGGFFGTKRVFFCPKIGVFFSAK